MKLELGNFEEKITGKPYDLRLLRRLYPFTRPYRHLFFYSMLLVMVITSIDLAIPYITKIAIDRYIVPHVHTGIANKTNEFQTKTRYYSANLKDPDVKKIVSHYDSLFILEKNSAHIRFGDLPKLAKNDLAILRHKDLSGVGLAASILLVFICIHFCFNFAQQMLMEYCGQNIMHDLRMKLFCHIQELSIAFFTRNPVGRLVTRTTNDVQNMHEMFTSIVTFVFKDIFLLLGITILLLSIHWKLALISFTVLPFVLLISFKFAAISRNVFRVLRIKIAEINSIFSETIQGIQVIQTFLLETENFNTFRKLNHENYLAGIKQIHVFALFMPVIELLGSTAVAIVIFYGGSSVLTQQISLGALVAFISYMRMFFRPVRDISEKYNVMQNAMASAERIFLLLDTQDRLPILYDTTPAPLKKITSLTFKDVSFQYVSEEIVLKDINFTIKAGETIAVVGPTGAGKTTLTHLIMQFYDPTSGLILINKNNIKDFDTAIVRSKMAIVMQDPFLFSGTIKDNILVGNSHLSDEAFDHILTTSNCKKIIKKLPDGLNTVLSEGGASLSSGERQLISIARAFAADPDLILFDEATSYIDSETEQYIQNAISNLMKTRTSIIITHRLSTARIADRIIAIKKGRIIEAGSHDELMQQKGYYYQLNQL